MSAAVRCGTLRSRQGPGTAPVKLRRERVVVRVRRKPASMHRPKLRFDFSFETNKSNALTAFPDSAWASQRALAGTPPCWPVSGLADATFIAFPVTCFRATSGLWDESGAGLEPGLVCLPLRGQRRLGVRVEHTLLLPVELRTVNQPASTNGQHFTVQPCCGPTSPRCRPGLGGASTMAWTAYNAGSPPMHRAPWPTTT